MNTITIENFMIDTLQFSQRMQKSGLKKEIADELAEVMKETQLKSFEKVATKQDLQILENNILLKIGKLIYISTGLIITMMGIAVAVIKI